MIVVPITPAINTIPMITPVITSRLRESVSDTKLVSLSAIDSCTGESFVVVHATDVTCLFRGNEDVDREVVM